LADRRQIVGSSAENPESIRMSRKGTAPLS